MGNPKAQLKLYRLYCDAMYHIAFRYLKHTQLAEDVTQEAFIKAFSHLKNYDAESSFGAWLKQIVIHCSIDELRKRKHNLSLDDLPNLSRQCNDPWEVEPEVDVDTIKAVIDELPSKYSIVLKLFLMEGYDHQEIAEFLQISINASRTQLHRGKIMLINQLIQKGYERFA